MTNDNAPGSTSVEALRVRLEQVQREAQTYRGQVFRQGGVKRVRELAPTPLSLPGNMTERERLQAMLAHAERERDRYRNAVQPIPVNIEGRKKRSRPAGRGGCLTAWLVLMDIALGIQVIGALWASFISSPGSSLPLLFFLLVLVVAIIQAGAISSIWHLQKLGYYTLVGFFLLRCLISLALSAANPTFIGLLVVDVIASLPGLGILSLLVCLRWYNFE